ncbi:MAG: radical SAM protein [Lachnospiraceae bacterium]|nr:radical SAM protein [Lachnospiraceae bacterium]
MKLTDKAKSTAIEVVAKQALGYLEKDPETNIPKLMDLVDKYTPKDWYAGQRNAIRNAIKDKDNNWYQLVMRMYQLDPGVRKAFFQNFIINASLKGSLLQEENMKENNCNSPWAILLDPTSACNLQCTGCWAAEYGHQLNLTLEEIDSIIRQGKEIGVYMYIYTGGEPTVRKKDIIKLCEMHPDCEFLAFTNGTLFDEEFCDEILRVKNFIPAFSVEGSEEANDGRRGKGIYQKVMHSMKLLKDRGLPFGVSTCYTAANVESVSSEEYFDTLIDSGAYFAWFFHYMPVGNDASAALLPSPEQRKLMYSKIREYRKTKSLFTLDFQNDAEYVHGCVAGGRYYLHINAKGDVEPCVFIHYSNCNIKNTTLKDALKSPIFQAYHDNQPFNDNMLRPCPMLENPEALRKMVKETNAVNTDYQSPESVDDLCDKTTPYAENWKPTADEIWAANPQSTNPKPRKR